MYDISVLFALQDNAVHLSPILLRRSRKAGTSMLSAVAKARTMELTVEIESGADSRAVPAWHLDGSWIQTYFKRE
jgi:hypothetical protein